MQGKVRQELREAGVRVNVGVPMYADLEKLKLLDTVATEGLRLHPAAPASLPRVPPKGSAKIAGIWVPEDVSTKKLRDSERESFLRVFRPLFQ